MKKLCLTLVLIFILSSQSFSQIPHQEWFKSFSTNGSPCSFIDVDIQGNTYIAGSISWTDGPDGSYVTKLDPSGNVLYSVSVDTPCTLAGAYKDASDNFYVAGYTRFWSPIKSSIAKYNPLGVKQWRISESFNSNDAVIDLAGDASGNPYMLRIKNGINQVIKYNSSGSQQFIFNITDTLSPRRIYIDHQSNIIILGDANPGGASYSIVTIKYSSAGVRQWKSVFVTPVSYQNSPHWKIKAGNTGNIYIMASISYQANSIDYGVIKYNSSGQQQWAAHYDRSQYDAPMDMVLDASENTFVTGSSGTVKFNSSGVFQWAELTTGMSAVVQDLAGNSYAAGSIGIGNFSGMNTIKITPAGVLQWNISYSTGAPFSDWADAIVLDTSRYVIITGLAGYTPMPGYRGGAAVIKYSQLNGIENINADVPKHFSLSQNYPNPFNPSTKFKIEIAKSSFAKVIVFDILGREVAALVNQQLQPGTYEVNWDASDYPSGVYFYKLTVNSEQLTLTKKMILMK